MRLGSPAGTSPIRLPRLAARTDISGSQLITVRKSFSGSVYAVSRSRPNS